MEHGTPWLQMSLVYLGAAVLAVPLARLLGLGSIIGYLAAGIAIGPFGLRLVTDTATMRLFQIDGPQNEEVKKSTYQRRLRPGSG